MVNNIFYNTGDKNLAHFPQPHAVTAPNLQEQFFQRQAQDRAMQAADTKSDLSSLGKQGAKVAGNIFAENMAERAVGGGVEALAKGGMGEVASLAAAEGAQKVAETASSTASGLGSLGASAAGTATEMGLESLGVDGTTADVAGKLAKYGTAFAMGGPMGMAVPLAFDVAGSIFG